MSRRRRTIILGSLLAVLLLLAGGFFLAGRADPWLRRKAHEACPRCEFRWDKLEFGVRGLVFKNFYFRSEPGEISVYSLAAERLEVRLRWWRLNKGVADIRAIFLDNGEVKVMEIAGHKPAGPPPTSKFAIRGVHFQNFRFTYELREHGQFGRLRIHGINAEISSLGTTADLYGQKATGYATATLENSGRLQVEVEAVPFQNETNALVKISLEGLRLAEANAYFHPMDGVELAGQIIKGNASADVRGDALSAWADIRYRDFDIHFRRTKFRGGLKAILSSLIADIKLEKNSDHPHGKAVGIRRLPKESLVSFILRGLKQAALRVAAD